MSETAWYLGATRADVAERAILVGDPARVGRLAQRLEDVRTVADNRGLRTITGRHNGQRVTVAAFGMGAPIATIVLHELAALGVRRFLRIGTAMALPPAQLGDLVLAEGALRGEGTSSTYAPLAYPAIADFALVLALRTRLARQSRPWRAGVFGTYDGFYTEMFAQEEAQREKVAARRAEALRLRLVATDMETAALLTAARLLGAAAASLCLATVDGLSGERLAKTAQDEGEQALFAVALDGVGA